MFITEKHTERPYWFGLERLTADNYSRWYEYGRIQSKPKNAVICMTAMKHFISDGINSFYDVISGYRPDPENIRENRDVYICYASTAEPRPAGPEMDTYDLGESIRNVGPAASAAPTSESAGRLSGSFSPAAIVMFMTVTTSPGARIACHFGISASVEGALGGHRGLSVDLHKFAARAISHNYPLVKFMVTPPIDNMLCLLCRAFPADMRIGTKEMLELVTKRAEVDYETYLAGESELVERTLVKVQKWADIRAAADDDEESGPESESESESKTESEPVTLSHPKVREVLMAAYERYQNPYYYSFDPETLEFLGHGIASAKKVMTLYPPIISVDKNTKAARRFTIEGRDGEKIEFYKNGTDSVSAAHQWLFDPTYQPDAQTYYAAVDYKALASE